MKEIPVPSPIAAVVVTLVVIAFGLLALLIRRARCLADPDPPGS